jgi:hypothetical protein
MTGLRHQLQYLIAGLQLAAVSLAAADRFASPIAAGGGNGSAAAPWTLREVLAGAPQPGDTVWLRGGIYQLGHVITTLSGTSNAPIVLRSVPGDRATVLGSIVHWHSPGWVWYWGFELTQSPSTGNALPPGLPAIDLPKYNGFSVYAPHLRFINLQIHDQLGTGIYLAPEAKDCEVYGCLVYHNGEVAATMNAKVEMPLPLLAAPLVPQTNSGQAVKRQ